MYAITPAASALPAHPPLRLVDGPSPAGRTVGAGLDRVVRIVALVVVALAVAAAATFLARSEPMPTDGSPAVAGTHTVGADETMWSIAVSVAPAGEAAGYVERLVAVNGTATVVPGQVVELPVP